MKYALMTAVAMMFTQIPALADDKQRLDIHAFDISDSAPVAVNPHVARSAGNTIKSMALELSPGDQIKLRSLGTAGIAVEQININIKLGKTPRMRARKVAPKIGQLVSSFPALVKKGQIAVQDSTNIIGFVEAIASTLDCQARSVRLVLHTDGIEHSSQIKGRDLLSGKATLPLPSGEILKGCEVRMYGLGQQTAAFGTDSRWFPILRKQWSAFFTAAGVSRFRAYAVYE